jgi:hypothetical protein
MLEWQPRGNRRERVVKRRMLVMALGVVLALLGVAAPIASAKDSASLASAALMTVLVVLS